MKFNFILLFFFISCLYGQNWTLHDILNMKQYNLSEEEILQEIKEKGIQEKLTPQLFYKLRDMGFSSDFTKKLGEYLQGQQQGKQNQWESIKEQQKIENIQQEKKSPLYTIQVNILPEGAGKVEIIPPLNEDGQLPARTKVYIKPMAILPYYFEKWSQGASGIQPLEFELDNNIQLTAHFKVPQKQPVPQAINNPKDFQETRKQGYIYKGNTTAIVEGRGKNKDWGITGEVQYKYLYMINYTSTIESNNGDTIIETRKFDKVQQNLVLSPTRFYFDINEEWWKYFLEKSTWAIDMVSDYIIPLMPQNGVALKMRSRILKLSEHMVLPTVSMLVKKYFSFTEEELLQILDSIEENTINLGLREKFATFKEHVIMKGKILGYPKRLNLLEGKMFRLTYKDGVGLTSIDTTDTADILSLQEKELIERAFYMSDYYIFKDKDQPLRRLDIGTSWKVDAKNIASVLDPRMRHTTKGFIGLHRLHDMQKNNQNYAVFQIKNSTIQMQDTERNQQIAGEATFSNGIIHYDINLRYIQQAQLQGELKYRTISTDHLFFEAKMSTTPRFTIQYQCEVFRK
ncbi:MAG TPA: hypothetical protein PLB63_08510 [Planctomycetota bacterium]|nr:hypothetical protein [Planctomycetota bacterium]HQB00859.1 hypothetical protein [Planctomycetota bacterium]